MINAQVLINEVMPAPSQTDEWIELKNTSDQVISLSGWIVEDNTGALTPLPAFSQSSIPAGSYFVFEVKNRLNNTGDHLTLKQPDGAQVDYFEYGNSSTDLSWSRVSDSSDEIIQTVPTKGTVNLIPSPLPSPSPIATPSASPTSSPTQQPSPTAQPTPWVSPLPTTASPHPSSSPNASYPLQLSELVACPQTGEPEWVEFFNPNAVSVTISNWKLKDSSGNSRPLNLTFSPHSFASAELSSAILNNDGDTANVLDQDGRVLISVDLSACEKGQSTIFAHGSWQQTTMITKNALNVFSATTDNNAESETEVSVTPFYSEENVSTPSAFYQILPASFSFGGPVEGVNVSSEGATPATASTQHIPSLNDDSQTALGVGAERPILNNQQIKRPFYQQKVFLITLFIISSLAIGIGGFGVYQWYTELHAEEVLENL